MKTARVALTDDATPELAESFYLQLYSPTGLNLGTSLATATILDDQSSVPGVPVVSVSDTVVDEQTGRAYFSVTLTGRAPCP